MKKIKIKDRFANKTLTFLTLTTLLTVSCSLIGGFSRNTAAGLIEKDKRYTVISKMPIDIGGRIANAGAGIAQKSADETLEQAIPRAKEDFMHRQPKLLVAEQLGFIKLYFENGELGKRPMGAPRFDDDLKHWFFDARAEITDTGRQLWKDLNLPVDEEYLPLAVRGTPSVTGMKDENESMKSADFTYTWEANKLGKAFDSNSSEYKKLPQDLQEALKKNQYNLFGGGGNNMMDFRTARKGRAFFQKFDDGWRMSNLAFF